MTGLVERFAVTARDNTMAETGHLNGYRSLDLDLRLMGVGEDVGQCRIVLPNDHPNLPLLLDAGAGVVVRRAGSSETVASGDVVDAQVDQHPGGLADVLWEPDDGILLDELAYPDPDTDASSSSAPTVGAGYDVRSGPAETVLKEYLAANIGPAAGVVRRRYPWLSIPASAGLGTSGQWAARDYTLLSLARRIAVPSGIAWRLAQTASGEVEVEVWEPATVSTVRFSPQSGTLTALRLRWTAATVDEVVVAGSGEGTARVRTRRTATGVTAGRRRHVLWLDQRHTSDLAELRQAADEALEDGAVTAAAEFDLIERAGQRYGADWRLGDLVTVGSFRAGADITARVQSVRITHSPETGPRPVIHPGIGLPADRGITSLPTVRRLLESVLHI